MAFLRLCLLLVCVSLHLVHCLDKKSVKDQLTKGENQENLTLSYFPTNHPTSIVMDVHYSVQCNPSSGSGNDKRCMGNDDYKDLHFRWMQSYVSLIVRPELLQPLSLYTFQTDISPVNLTLNLTQDCCDIHEIEDEKSDCEKHTIGALGDLTANMQYYAKFQDTSTRLDENLGYSVLMYKQNLLYCMFNEVQKTHIFLAIANCILALFFSIGTPTILAAVYKRLYDKMDDPKKDWKYFVWAVAVVAFVLTIAVIIADGVIIVIYVEHIANYNDFYNSFYILISYTTLIFITLLSSFITVPLGVRYVQSLDTDAAVTTETGGVTAKKLSNFPVPRVLIICYDAKPSDDADGDTPSDAAGTTSSDAAGTMSSMSSGAADTIAVTTPSCTGNDETIKLIYMACWSFTVFLELVSFHGVFMILGVMASPVVPLSRITFYIAAFFCLVAFMAFFFKFSDKSDCDRLRENGCCNQNGCFKKECCIYVPPVLTAFLLFAGVVTFGVCYFYVSMLVNNQKNDDFFYMLSSFLPSALLGLATFCGKKLMGCLKETQQQKMVPTATTSTATMTITASEGSIDHSSSDHNRFTSGSGDHNNRLTAAAVTTTASLPVVVTTTGSTAVAVTTTTEAKSTTTSVMPTENTHLLETKKKSKTW